MQCEIDAIIFSLLDDWIKWLGGIKGFSHNTIVTYRADVLFFLRFLSEFWEEKLRYTSLPHIDDKDLRAWFASRRRKNISFRSNSRALSSIKSFFRYLAKYKEIVNESVPIVTLRFKEKKLPRALSVRQITELIEKFSCLKVNWIVKRNIALCYLMYGSGLRISEALSLKFSDLSCNEIKIIGKGNRERMIRFLPIVRFALKEYLALCPFSFEDDTFLFLDRNGNKLCRTSVARAILFLRRRFSLSENITPHALRHSFATHLLQNGVGIRKLQELLGHASLASTEVYTKLDTKSLMEKYRQARLRDDN